ncbi:MAG: TVP38/TMEM64 family protein [Proteobacteria bacterium]|nr:TVP38/TMEM64 family protein [Pseudomonadota bacterium]
MTAAPDPGTAPRRSLPRRLAPLAGLALILLLFFTLRLDRYVSFGVLRDNRAAVTGFVGAHAILAPLLFIGLYIVTIAASLPIGAILSVSGGFLFGTVPGTLYVLIGATSGATALFLAAQTAIGDSLKRRMGPAGERLARDLEGNAFSYLLVLRLVPLFPFVLVNLVPALVGIKLRAYVAATFLGIIPASFVYVSIGSGLGALLERGETPDLSTIFSRDVLVPLLGLAVLALIPVVYRRFKAKQPA